MGKGVLRNWHFLLYVDGPQKRKRDIVLSVEVEIEQLAETTTVINHN